MQVRFRRLAVVLVVLGLAATAAAQCSRAPNTSVVTLPDFLAVYYAQFRSLSEQDAAEFYGGVCVTAVGGEWTVIADFVRLDELSGNIRLAAPDPTLYFGEWRVRGTMIQADATGLTLENAVVAGPDVNGSAANLEVSIVTNEVSMRELQLEGSAFAVRGDLAVLEGNALRVEGAGLTTCIGIEQVPYEVLGEVAFVNLTDREVRVQTGALRIGALTVPLRDDIIVSDAAFEDFEFPVRVAFHSGGSSRLGAGLDIRIVNIPLAPNVDLIVGGTGLDDRHTTQGVLLLEVEAELQEFDAVSTVNAVAGLNAGMPYMDFRISRPVTSWLQVEFGAHTGAEPARHALYEGYTRLTATTSLPLFGASSGVRTTLTGEAFAAITAVTPAAVESVPTVAGPRVGALATSRTTWRATRYSTFTLDAGVEGTYYPATWGTDSPATDPNHQWAIRLVPSWRYVRGPVTLTLGYEARFTNSGSPFPTAIDRVLPLQRLTATGRVSGQLATTSSGVWTGAFGVQVTYDPFFTATPAGLKRLTLDGNVQYEVQPWRFRIGARTELSGLIVPVGRDPFVELSLTARRNGWPVLNPNADSPNVPHGEFQVGLVANYSLIPGAERLARLELNAGVPLTFNSAELRPYLAFNFAPLVNEGLWPAWTGYGLDATFITCCGSFTIGVLSNRGEWSAGISVDLERRPQVASNRQQP